jgi:hypothetical protein
LPTATVQGNINSTKKQLVMKKIVTRVAGLWVVLALFVSSCTKPTQTGSIQQLEKFYSSIKVNGEEISFSENENGYVNGYGKGGAYVPVLGKYFERQFTSYAIAGENKFNIYFMATSNSNPPSNIEIQSMFYEGNYEFGNSNPNFLKPGVEIRYIDNKGVEWTSQGDQTNSYFEVTKHEKNTSDTYTPYKTSGKFNCRLYNSLGEYITVTDGKFNGRTVVYY